MARLTPACGKMGSSTCCGSTEVGFAALERAGLWEVGRQECIHRFLYFSFCVSPPGPLFASVGQRCGTLCHDFRRRHLCSTHCRVTSAWHPTSILDASWVWHSLTHQEEPTAPPQ